MKESNILSYVFTRWEIVGMTDSEAPYQTSTEELLSSIFVLLGCLELVGPTIGPKDCLQIIGWTLARQWVYTYGTTDRPCFELKLDKIELKISSWTKNHQRFVTTMLELVVQACWTKWTKPIQEVMLLLTKAWMPPSNNGLHWNSEYCKTNIYQKWIPWSRHLWRWFSF